MPNVAGLCPSGPSQTDGRCPIQGTMHLCPAPGAGNPETRFFHSQNPSVGRAAGWLVHPCNPLDLETRRSAGSAPWVLPVSILPGRDSALSSPRTRHSDCL